MIKGNLVTELRDMEADALEMHHMPDCKVYPNRTAVLKDIPKNGMIAEVGVAYGDFSEVLIAELNPKKFIAIDSFSIISSDEEPWGKNELTKTGMTHEDYYRKRFEGKVNMEIKKGYSWEKLGEFEDDYFDYIYVDAGHKYPDVSRDIEALTSKVKVNGYVQFNDYTIMAPTWLEAFGVPKAVNELLLSGGFEMTAFCLQTGGYHDVVLKRVY